MLKTISAAGALILLGGCSDQTIRTYKVPKEERFTVAAARHDHAQGARPGLPHLHWGDLPAGWQEKPPERMRAASFRVMGSEGRLADVLVIPLPGVGPEMEAESVNLWRQELQLQPLKPDELAEHRQTIEVGGSEASFYDLVSTTNLPGQTFSTRTLGVILPREEALWFIKMIGEADLVKEQKDAFAGFLKNLEFHAGSHGEPPVVSANTARVPPEASLPKWEVPEGWQEKVPGSMLLASFQVSPGEGGPAEVTVSKLPRDGGGLLPNINRWRGQLGLEPVGPAEMKQFITEIEVDAEKVPLVEFQGTSMSSGEEARLLVIAVPRQGETWFYKLMGDNQTVVREKDTFVRFVQSAY